MKTPAELETFRAETLYFFPLKAFGAIRAAALLLLKLPAISDLLWRAVRGPEPISRRIRTVAHTYLGAYVAISLRKECVRHIHIHHGYFSAWAGMVAARLLDATFSMTLHGSDLLVRADYIDSKLANCQFCVTVSEFNHGFIRNRYPTFDFRRVVVHRLGVDPEYWRPGPQPKPDAPLSILSVGRLHAVKNHAFLLWACAELAKAGVPFRCVIAGQGEERERLLGSVRELGLQNRVEFPGQVQREHLRELYREADVIVFTSRSEGIPLAGMEAMAMERIVLAPAITGIPELIKHGKTGFLYQPDSLEDFVAKLMAIRSPRDSLQHVRSAARKHVEEHFSLPKNLKVFADDFIRRVELMEPAEKLNHAHPVLQQI
jgi:glycosyltransferase involved in cell wall biosynthesis